MTQQPPVQPASDEEVSEFFDLLQSFGCDAGEGSLARCATCYGPWFDTKSDGNIPHDPTCATVVGPKVLARIRADEERHKREMEALQAKCEQTYIRFSTVAALRAELAASREECERLKAKGSDRG